MDRPEWLLFDLDNTLLDFDRSSEEAFFSLLKHHAYTEPSPRLYASYSQINHELWEQREQGLISAELLKEKRWSLFFDKAGLEGISPEQANREYFHHIASAVHFVPGAQELLEELHPHFRMMIVTNGLSEVQRPRLENAGILKYFEHIVISDEIGWAKPQEEFFSYCAGLMEDPPPGRVLVIGDTLKSDIRGANHWGYRSCWFNHDRRRMEGPDVPDIIIESLEELSGFIVV